MKAEETVDFHIRWAWYKINKWYNQRAGEYDGTMAMGYVLLNIDSKEGTPSTQLGPKMGMESTSLVRLLKSMENKGLIIRKPDRHDRRKVIIFLTDKGHEKRSLARETVVSLNTSLYAQLSEREVQQFMNIMQKINQYLNQFVKES